MDRIFILGRSDMNKLGSILSEELKEHSGSCRCSNVFHSPSVKLATLFRNEKRALQKRSRLRLSIVVVTYTSQTVSNPFKTVLFLLYTRMPSTLLKRKNFQRVTENEEWPFEKYDTSENLLRMTVVDDGISRSQYSGRIVFVESLLRVPYAALPESQNGGLPSN